MNRLAQARGSLGAGLFVFPVCVFIVGCAGKAPKQTPFMKSVGTVTFTTNELRLRAYEYESWFSAIVQSTTHQIIDTTREARIYEAALLWKINAIPAMQKAIFQTDPLAGLATACLSANDRALLWSSIMRSSVRAWSLDRGPQADRPTARTRYRRSRMSPISRLLAVRAA